MAINYSVTKMEERRMAVLKIEGELIFVERSRFQEAIGKLFATNAAKLVIDLGKVSRMSSVFIGTLIDHGNIAKAHGKSLSIVLPEQMAKVCRDTGLPQIANIIVDRR